MKNDFSVKDAVVKRYSARTYENRKLDETLKAEILSYAEKLDNPLGPKIRIQFIEKETDGKGEKLGTYGVIKGASQYLAVTVPDEPYALEALGYDFEKLVLYLTSKGLGTCWLGGTFKRSDFVSKIEIADGELFPILSPVGYPAAKKSLTERIMRRAVKADDRVPWNEIFFKNDFNTTYSDSEAGEYAMPLEMVRLAPSAVNRQPWRIVADEKGFHFFEKLTKGSLEDDVDMHRIDVGIATCHFHMAAEELGLQGHFERSVPEIEVPEGLDYIVSWIRE